MPLKHTKKVQVRMILQLYRYIYQVSDLLLQDISTVDTASDWLIPNLGMATQDDRTDRFLIGRVVIYYSVVIHNFLIIIFIQYLISIIWF